MNSNRTTISLVILLSLAFFGVLALSQPLGESDNIHAPKKANEEVSSTRQFVAPDLRARAVLVFDPHTREVLYEKESGRVLPLASLTKIMTAIVALEHYRGETLVETAPGISWSLTQFLERMLVNSSNTAAETVAALPFGPGEQGFVVAMNNKARRLGFDRMYFRNSTGLDVGPQTAGGEGTATEVAELLWYGTRVHPKLFAATSEERLTLRTATGDRYSVYNTNQIVASLPAVLASKTGLTDLAGGNLAMIIDAGIEHPIVIVILGSSEAGRFTDIQKLTQATLAYFASDVTR